MKTKVLKVSVVVAVLLAISSAQAFADDEYLAGWGLFSLVPDAEGVSWTSGEFDLPSLEAGQAHLIIDLVQVEGTVDTGAWINDVYIGAFSQCLSADEWAVDRSVTIDSAVLLPTGNVISIQAGLGDTGNYDDFMFRNLRVEYVPEPATMSLLGLGGIAVLGGKRRKTNLRKEKSDVQA